MEPCKGFEDWLECLNCPYLCTKACPIEGEDVMEEMKRHMHFFSVSRADNEKKVSDNLD